MILLEYRCYFLLHSKIFHSHSYIVCDLRDNYRTTWKLCFLFQVCSNARFKSRKRHRIVSFLSFISFQSAITIFRAVSHDWFFRYPDCYFHRRLFSSMNYISWWFMIASNSLCSVLSVFIGRWSSSGSKLHRNQKIFV